MVAPTARFTANTVAKLAERLRTRRTALSHCVESLRLEATEAHNGRDLSDLLDHEDPSADLDTQTLLILAQRADDHLREVEDALDRVAAGSYGYCLGCARGIPLERLRALPATTRFVECSRWSSSRMRHAEATRSAGLRNAARGLFSEFDTATSEVVR